MEIFLSAILSEMTSRSINFFIGKSSKQMAQDVENRLCRALLRAQVIVDEAMGRRITNQAMIKLLGMLTDAMHRGYYMLDTFRCQSYGEEDPKVQVVSRSLSLSKVNSFKGFCSSSRNTQIYEKLQEALEDLSSLILDVKELAVFLMSYPRRYRQPYSMHLLLDNCMFGHQMEAEHAINFLLCPQPHGAEEVEVLPIVGPGKVGKSTFVAHVCKDERVRGHFTEILFLRGCGFRDDELATFREGCATRHLNHVSNSNKDERLLVAVELDEDLSEHGWNKLYSVKRYLPNGSKIIVTSRSDKTFKFGTTQGLTLKHPSREAYWYFFKTLAFGSTDPEMHPGLVYLAMEIARVLDGTLFRASITACLLRDNFDIRFWRKVLAFLKGISQKHDSGFCEHPFNLADQNRPARFKVVTRSEDFLIYHQYHQRSSEEEVPKIRIQNVIYGNLKPHGKFEALAWRSRLPPYQSYVYTCEIREQKLTGAKRKRHMRDEVTLC